MFNVIPNEQERRTKRGTVELFYVGVDYDRAHKGYPPPVQVLTLDPIEMPALGESIVFDEVYAKTLIFKTRYKDRQGVMRDSFVPAAQGGAEMARFIRQAIKEGRSLDPQDLQRQATKAQAEAILPDADIAEILRSRGYQPPAELLAKLQEQAEGDAAENAKNSSLFKPEDLIVDLRSPNEKQAAKLGRGKAK